MLNSTDRRANEKAERDAAVKTRRRAEQASIVEGLNTVLESGEHLLAFARGRIAGGWRGKLNVGLEAFFAPFVNVGLSDRRFILQHIHPESGKPSEITPHFFPFGDIASLAAADLEAFAAEPSCRLILRLNNDLYFRVRLDGKENYEDGMALAEVFKSLTKAQAKSTTTPVQRVCPSCAQILDQPAKFCPYCGQKQPEEAAAPSEPVENVQAPSPPAPVPPIVMPPAPMPPEPPVYGVPPMPPELYTPSAPTPPEPPVAPEPPASPEPPQAPEPSTPPEAPAPPVPPANTSPWEAWRSPVPDTSEAATAHYEQPASEMLADAITDAHADEPAQQEHPEHDAPHTEHPSETEGHTEDGPKGDFI